MQERVSLVHLHSQAKEPNERQGLWGPCRGSNPQPMVSDTVTGWTAGKHALNYRAPRRNPLENCLLLGPSDRAEAGAEDVGNPQLLQGFGGLAQSGIAVFLKS